MVSVRVRNLEIGEGLPKICVPIVGVTKEEILDEAAHIAQIAPDLVEWRIDFYENTSDIEAVVNLAHALNETLGADIPLLCTIRTAAEGGQFGLSSEHYSALNKALMDSGAVDIIDVEMFLGDEMLDELVAAAQNSNVKVLASSHDFNATPPQDEIIARLNHMQEHGADILKIAVMPQSKRDVVELIAATEEMVSNHASQPVVTMSMGGLGSITRMCGEVFGSAITFGCATKASAPGQIDVNDLKTLIAMLHKSL